MRVTSKGQVTIPQALREQVGLLPHTEVRFELDGDGVRIVPVQRVGEGERGRRVLSALRGRASGGLSTDEILSLTREA